jgi:hypothetical protein
MKINTWKFPKERLQKGRNDIHVSPSTVVLKIKCVLYKKIFIVFFLNDRTL